MNRVNPSMSSFPSTRSYKLLGEAGDVNCSELMNAYEFFQARAALTVPDALAGPYQLYASAVQHFLSGSEGTYVTCRNFLLAYAADHSHDSFFSFENWKLAQDA